MKNLEVSVIIPIRNRPTDLARCLEALVNQDFPKDRYEIIVCDDGSQDDVYSAVRNYLDKSITVHYLKLLPRGPASARNAGIRKAIGSIVAMTDSDTIPDKSWLRKLVEALETHPDAVAVEGKVYADNDGEFGPLGEGPTNLTGGVFLTCNCAYRKDVLYAIGGFDETFPMPAYEDTDLAARALEIGPIVWQPEAVIIHPQRPITAKSVWKKLRHWEFITIMGYRYGYLGWKQYPVKYPRIRVPLLAVIALPLSKFKKAAHWLMKDPKVALKLATFGIVESVGALFVVTPKILSGNAKRKSLRIKYL